MNFDLSPGYLFTSLVVSMIGLGFFMYGKRSDRMPHLVSGLGLMLYPYFVTSVGWMLAVGAAILGGLWFAVQYGL